MFSTYRVVLGECRSCGQLAPLAIGNVRVECVRIEEAEIDRLTRAWKRDLDLLERFEAYSAQRAVQGD
jgi:hypothetical protein